MTGMSIRANPIERSVAETIRMSLGKLTPMERRPALSLLAHYPVAGLETVAQLARRAGVSGPTVLRLVAKLGFASYLDFQQALRDELEMRTQTPLEKAPRLRPGSEGADFLTVHGQAIVANIERSLMEIPRPDFVSLIDLLADGRGRVLLLGGRFTGSLALHLYQHLRELREGVELVDGQTQQWAEHLLDVGRKDVLIVYDIRRYQDDVVRFAREAAALGVVVVLMTDHWISPIAAVARHVFPVRTRMPSSWESFAALLSLGEAVVAQLHERLWGSAKSRMERLEAVRTRLSRE
jgi:DNA-binding MurR/RpiR family transcriptional regulator